MPEYPQDEDLERLLNAVGPRESPPEALVAHAHAELRAEWRAVVRERKQRGRTWRYGIAASLMAVSLGAWWLLPANPPSTALTVAQVTRSVGDARAELASTGIGLHDESPLPAGTELHTGAGGRVAIELPGSISVRLDEHSRLQLAAADRLVLLAGAIYVDVPPESGDSALQIETRYGTVNHLGTQYLTRLLPNHGPLELSVREGRVQIQTDGARTHAAKGERLTLHANGAMQRTNLLAGDTSWAWTAEVAPDFAIDGVALMDFLKWTTRETGLTLVFDSSEAEQAARATLLRGTISGLKPELALRAVMATTGLEATTSDGVIHVHKR